LRNAIAARPQMFEAGPTACILAVVVAAMAFLNLVDAATPTLLGRDLNLYWDLPHLPSLFGLASEAAGVWRTSGAIALLSGAILLLIAGITRIWREVLSVLTDRRVALGFTILLGAAMVVTVLMPAEERPLATGLGLDIIRQSAALMQGRFAATGAGRPYASPLSASAPPHSELAGLKQRDVYLVYIESYGTTVFDTPEFRTGLSQSLSQFETSLRSAGYTVASNRLISPTFGGGSWLAHATLASGAAWGFDHEIFASELDYRGPSFGWFAIPDQFTLDRAATIRSALGPTPPVFTQLILVSSHIPFAPVPPYLADWDDSGTFSTASATVMDHVWRLPEWSRLAPEYLDSLRYDFTVLGGWLTSRMSGDGLIILLGDHQPPAIVGGQPQPPWTVPIHVLSRDPDLVAPFVAEGYVSGIIPTQAPPHPGMETFLARFLAAFDRPG